MDALVVLEKDVEEEGMDEALVNFVTHPGSASWVFKRSMATSPSLSNRHLVLRAAAAKRCWMPEERTYARRVPMREFRPEFPS